MVSIRSIKERKPTQTYNLDQSDLEGVNKCCSIKRTCCTGSGGASASSVPHHTHSCFSTTASDREQRTSTCAIRHPDDLQEVRSERTEREVCLDLGTVAEAGYT